MPITCFSLLSFSSLLQSGQGVGSGFTTSKPPLSPKRDCMLLLRRFLTLVPYRIRLSRKLDPLPSAEKYCALVVPGRPSRAPDTAIASSIFLLTVLRLDLSTR